MTRKELLDDTHGTQLGRLIEVRPGDPAVSIIRAFGEDHLAQMMTVVASAEVRPGLSELVEVVGTLRWGTAGQQNTAEFDFLLGTVMSVPAAYVEVLAEVVTGSTPLRVSASVGYGSRPSSVPSVFRTIRATTSEGVPAGTGPFFATTPIPRWSSVGIVAFSTDSGATVTVEVLSVSGGTLYKKTWFPANPSRCLAEPITSKSRAQPQARR